MNTEGEKIQWHPAFDAALQIELGEEAKYLTFEPEHLLSKKPMQIDVLVKNEKKVKIRKNIGRIFRQHNIIEYKSPEDHLNIDDFYKVYGYTCIYKTEVEKVNQIPAEELTITFVCYHYPRQMLRNLQNERNINVKNIENGIYYLYGDAIPIQLIIVPELSIENNYWLNKLRNNLKSGGEIKLFMEQYEKNRDSKLFQALADTVMRANWKEVEEEGNMSDVIKEIFADQFHKCEAEARAQGGTEVGNIVSPSIGSPSGLHPHTVHGLTVLHVVGVHVAGGPEILAGIVHPAPAVGDTAHKVVPLPVVGRGTPENPFRLRQIVLGNELAHLNQRGIVVAAAALAGGPATAIPVPAGRLVSALGPGLHDGVIGLIDLFHLGLGQVGQRVIGIVVRVILLDQVPIGAFDLLLTGRRAHAQHGIGIIHTFPSPYWWAPRQARTLDDDEMGAFAASTGR